MPSSSDPRAPLPQDPSRRPRVPGVENSDGPAQRGEVWSLGGGQPGPTEPPATVLTVLLGVGPRDPDPAEGTPPQITVLTPAPPPAEAPEGQGQGPQAAEEHRRVSKEWRGPAEVRGGAQAGRAGAVGRPWRWAGGGAKLNPTSAHRGRRRSRRLQTAAQDPGTGWAGRVWAVCGVVGAPHDALLALTPALPRAAPLLAGSGTSTQNQSQNQKSLMEASGRFAIPPHDYAINPHLLVFIYLPSCPLLSGSA